MRSLVTKSGWVALVILAALGFSSSSAQAQCSNNAQINNCQSGCPSSQQCGFYCLGGCSAGCEAERLDCRSDCEPFATAGCLAACDSAANTCQGVCTSRCNVCVSSCQASCVNNLCVFCNADGPYRAECAGATTSLTLNGTGSSTTSGQLFFLWGTDCPSGSFDNQVFQTPILTLDSSPGCSVDCGVRLQVTNQNGGTATCNSTVAVRDTTRPAVHCPDPITLSRGDKICNTDVQDWLDSFSATDLCTPTADLDTWMTELSDCGLPAGSTTTVGFSATDDCGNTSRCTSDITIEPLQRVSSDQKGSLLVFSKVEVKWDANGNLIQDTLLDISNDADGEPVEVQAYFINGDIQIEEELDANGNLISTFEPGWNTADCRFQLTQNQPHFWSAANGSTRCQPFTVLDMDGPGRLDPTVSTASGPRVLRGYVVMFAVANIQSSVAGATENGFWQEIRWNDLKGDAIVINYAESSAWEYNAWAYQNTCVEHGEAIQDCLERDDAGTCCLAKPVPGILPIDGFSYDVNFDTLLLDFYASGSTGLSRSGVTVMADTELVLHSMDLDVRQDGQGPVLTKVEAEIFNENESKFSGTRRCICCWDGTDLSAYGRDASVPNHFLRTKLGTNKGTARLDGVDSDECDYEEICGVDRERRPIMMVPRARMGRKPGTPLLGVAAKELTFTGAINKVERAGMNLVGTGEESSVILYDFSVNSGELTDGGQ